MVNFTVPNDVGAPKWKQYWYAVLKSKKMKGQHTMVTSVPVSLGAVLNATGDAEGRGEPRGLTSAGVIVFSIDGVAEAVGPGSVVVSSGTGGGSVTSAGATGSGRLGE